jgi:hypothetical protein
MPDSYWDPPEPPEPCCAAGEDDEDHDVEQCLADQAEAAAEAKAERQREDRMWDEMPGPGDTHGL